MYWSSEKLVFFFMAEDFHLQNILEGGKLNDDLFIGMKQRLIRQIVQGSSAE